jgi:hypothetical protein
MDHTDQQFANRCLPLLIANSSGWFVNNNSHFTARWNGGARAQDLTIEYQNPPPYHCAHSHFGAGVITFSLPYLFETEPGTNLWVRGPTNLPKVDVHPLEGIVETDWSAATFTMNWKIQRPGVDVVFEANEPICMIVPFPRGFHENLLPCYKSIDDNSELRTRHLAWAEARSAFLRSLARGDEDAVRQGWQRDYFLGKGGPERLFNGHQTNVTLKEFSVSALEESTFTPTL